jgi:hypothetical protein
MIFGKEEIDDFVLVADGVLLDKLEYTLLRLEVYLPRMSLYIRMRRRHCFKALEADIISRPIIGILAKKQKAHAAQV